VAIPIGSLPLGARHRLKGHFDIVPFQAPTDLMMKVLEIKMCRVAIVVGAVHLLAKHRVGLTLSI
jgi:hypothetical protein